MRDPFKLFPSFSCKCGWFFVKLMLLAILVVGVNSPSRAQDAPDNSMYEVTDVAVDVTADSAAHAKDQAIAQGQRAAFLQLLDRLGVDSGVAAKLSDDDIATLVQS